MKQIYQYLHHMCAGRRKKESKELVTCLSDRFHLVVLFLEICSVLSFGMFFLRLVWQPPSVCFCVLGRTAMYPGLLE